MNEEFDSEKFYKDLYEERVRELESKLRDAKYSAESLERPTHRNEFELCSL